jgi:hypothetical protein
MTDVFIIDMDIDMDIDMMMMIRVGFGPESIVVWI